jgi:diguanylate cyclase (GGDEF)-like protein/PAS domain S-box-containing protein
MSGQSVVVGRLARAGEQPAHDTPAARPTPRTAMPFLLLSALGLASILLPPYSPKIWHLFVVAGLVAAMVKAYVVSMGRVERSWVDLVAPLGAFPLIVVVRDATGGDQSGLAALVAIPILWLAVFGTRRDLWAAAALAALTFVLPVLVVGEPAYSVGEWRQAVLWPAIALVIAPVLMHVVRRLAVESIRSQEIAARFEGIVRGATLSSLITTDVDGVITTFGVGAEKQTGYRAADVLGRELTSVCFHHAELETVAEELRVSPDFAVLTRLAHTNAGSRVWGLRRADGETGFVRMSVTSLRDAHDQVTGYLCVGVDATSATRAERALTQAEQRWRILMDHLPDTTVIMVEEKTGITVVTGAGILARRLRDGAGRRLQEIVDGEVPGTLDRMLSAAFAGQEVPPVYAMVGKAEHEFQASPLPSTTHRRQAILWVRDVSRDRDGERTLMVAKERAERLFEDAPQGIALLEPDGTVVQVNPALTALLGGEDVLGRQLRALSSDADDLTVEVHLTRVREAADRRAEAQWTVRGAGGDELHVVLISTMLHGENGGEDLILTNVVDVSERYRYERQLAFLAEHDPLTGLANRRRFDQTLARHVDDCRRYGPRGAVLMLDLDHFKEVNDTLGHAVGDELLVDVARVLLQRMRSTDLVARLGGDEFAVLLPHADKKSAELVAASLVETLRDEVSGLEDTRSGVTASIGGVLIEEAHLSASDVLSAADAAMYVAKHSGRSRYTFLTVEE